ARNRDDEQIVFYRDITKVEVISESDNFAIQVVTKDVVVEMEFADADSVRGALRQFEAKRVVMVDFDTPGAVRISPSHAQPGCDGRFSPAVSCLGSHGGGVAAEWDGCGGLGP